MQCTGDDRGIQYENRYGDDEQCKIWALAGECAVNPGFMLTRCWAACTGYEGPTHCVNTYVSSTVGLGRGGCRARAVQVLGGAHGYEGPTNRAAVGGGRRC